MTVTRSFRRACAAGLASSVLAAGCGPVAGIDPLDAGGVLPAWAEAPLDPPPGTSDEAKDALAVWRDMPVDAAPRPIVMSGSDVHASSGSEGLTMILSLRFDDPAELPAGPAEAGGYPVVGAEDALALMHRTAEQFPRGQRVTVTGMEFGSATFWTDRGRQKLPAWIVRYAAARPNSKTQTAYVLAVAPSARFGPVSRDDAGVRRSADGMSILIPYSGQGPASGPCSTAFDTDVVETRGAIAYHVTKRQTDPHAVCDGPGRRDYVRSFAEVRLARPLGNRVVVQAGRGTFAYPVMACDQESWYVDLPPCGEAPIALFSPAARIGPATLRRWSDFAADADPRPIVLLGSGIQNPAFDSGPQRRAYRDRRWNEPERLPSAPSTVEGYPVISAAEALVALRRGKPRNTAPGPRVTITGMRLGTSTFPTDRGLRELPAWLVDFRGVESGSVAVPAVAAPARYVYRAKSYDGISRVHVDDSGRDLTVEFVSARWTDGPCDREFEIARAESAQIVAIELVLLRRAPGVDSDPTSRCESVGPPSYGMFAITFPLASPLGGRVVVSDVRNAPIALADRA